VQPRLIGQNTERILNQSPIRLEEPTVVDEGYSPGPADASPVTVVEVQSKLGSGGRIAGSSESTGQMSFAGDLANAPLSTLRHIPRSSGSLNPAYVFGSTSKTNVIETDPERIDDFREEADRKLAARGPDMTMAERDRNTDDAMQLWRDALNISLGTTTQQDKDTSDAADETLRRVRSVGYLNQFRAQMEREMVITPDEVPSWRILGHLYTVQGPDEAQLAVQAWRNVTRAGQSTAEDWYQLGLADDAAGNLSEARNAYSQVIKIDWDDQSLRRSDALAHLQMPGN
jgi:hypothetical protein